MKQFFLAVGAGLVAVLVGVANYFKSKAERLEAESRERDARERAEVLRMEERIAAVKEAHRDRKPIDSKNRNHFGSL
jgi:hypothetical protein